MLDNNFIFNLKKRDLYNQEVYFLAFLANKFFTLMQNHVDKWDSCDHEYDDIPWEPKRCLKCNAKAEEIEVLMLCKEILGRISI